MTDRAGARALAAEVAATATERARLTSFEDFFLDDETPPARRFRAVFDAS